MPEKVKEIQRATIDSGIVTADSGKPVKIDHDQTKSPVTFARNGRSR